MASKAQRSRKPVLVIVVRCLIISFFKNLTVVGLVFSGSRVVAKVRSLLRTQSLSEVLQTREGFFCAVSMIGLALAVPAMDAKLAFEMTSRK